MRDLLRDYKLLSRQYQSQALVEVVVRKRVGPSKVM